MEAATTPRPMQVVHEQKSFPWTMDRASIIMSHANGEINLMTYIKYAIRHDYGKTNRAEIDCREVSVNWSYDVYNDLDKEKHLELEAEDVLRVLLQLVEKGWFRSPEVGEVIQLNLLPTG